MEKDILNKLLLYYKDLDYLALRLQNDYNGVEEFKQTEEDRLIIYNILNELDNYKELINKQTN